MIKDIATVIDRALQHREEVDVPHVGGGGGVTLTMHHLLARGSYEIV